MIVGIRWFTPSSVGDTAREAEVESLIIGRGWSRLGRRILILALCSLMVACGGGAPRSVVEQALKYQMTQPLSPRQELLGAERLPEQVFIKGVKINRDQPLTIPSDEGQSLNAHRVQGTYTLTIDPPGGEDTFVRRQEPFQLTLAEVGEEKTWMLAVPDSQSSQSPTWTTVEFLPQPPPPPSSVSTDIEDRPGAEGGSSELPDRITNPLEEEDYKEIPFREETETRY